MNKPRKSKVKSAGQNPIGSGQILKEFSDRFSGHLFKYTGKVVWIIETELKS